MARKATGRSRMASKAQGCKAKINKVDRCGRPLKDGSRYYCDRHAPKADPTNIDLRNAGRILNEEN